MAEIDSIQTEQVYRSRSISKPAGPLNDCIALGEELEALLNGASDDQTDDQKVSEAQLVITKVMDTSKVASDKSARPIVQPTESVTHASSGAAVVSAIKVAPFEPALSPTMTGKETAEDLVNDYYFPASDVMDDPSADHAELMDELESLAQQVKKSDDYLGIRDQYCEIAVRLNLRGLWAPAFRPELQIPWKAADVKPAHKLIQRDRIVIDCHWLHAKGYKIRPKEKCWRSLCNPDMPFPFELAAEFAERKMANEYRADAVLSLTAFQQFQMRALCGTAVQARIVAIDPYRRVNGKRVPTLMETITLAVNRWCELDRRVLPHREKYLAHAQARALLEIASPIRKKIAELAGMIQGVQALSESTVRGFMAKLDKKLSNSA